MNNINHIHHAGLRVYPDVQLSPVRMLRTLAETSFKAFIRLISGGLKVGEINIKRKYQSQYHGISEKLIS
jgi:hypothetical protein